MSSLAQTRGYLSQPIRISPHRLLPVFLGRDADDEADEGRAAYLLHGGEELQQYLPASKRQGLLTDGGEHAEDGQATDEGGGVPQHDAVIITTETGSREEGEDGPAGEVVAFNKTVRLSSGGAFGCATCCQRPTCSQRLPHSYGSRRSDIVAITLSGS